MPLSKEFPTSTSVQFVQYDEHLCELEVRFRKGGIYLYIDVPQSTVDSLLQAESVGAFVAKNIAKKFRYKKIS